MQTKKKAVGGAGAKAESSSASSEEESSSDEERKAKGVEGLIEIEVRKFIGWSSRSYIWMIYLRVN